MSRFCFENIAGCLIGGAVGDALGAPVENLSLDEIRKKFGRQGIQNYFQIYDRLGAITDDTQMTLFTLDGMMRAIIRSYQKSNSSFTVVLWYSYLRWLATQGEIRKDIPLPDGWLENSLLYRRKELHQRRGPGNTCLSALRKAGPGTIEKPTNNSKGCGGVMRVAPVGFFKQNSFKVGCEVAAITHGHPTGYLAAGFLARLIFNIIHLNMDIGDAIYDARSELMRWDNHEECLQAINKAIDLAHFEEASPKTVEKLGQGRIAEEALAIAIFCTLKAHGFADGIRLAVNHSGDSDSTGAITGNILGAIMGVSAIPFEFLDKLELRDLMEQMVHDVLDLEFKWQTKEFACKYGHY